MKLSNQNIYNLRGCKNFWGRCQMSLGGANHFCGGAHPPHPPENPCLFPPKKMINYGMQVLECLQGRMQDFFTRGSKVYMPKKVPNIRRTINDILKIVSIVFSRVQLPPPPVSPLCTVLNV
jgi:hypothetical protein